MKDAMEKRRERNEKEQKREKYDRKVLPAGSVHRDNTGYRISVLSFWLRMLQRWFLIRQRPEEGEAEMQESPSEIKDKIEIGIFYDLLMKEISNYRSEILASMRERRGRKRSYFLLRGQKLTDDQIVDISELILSNEPENERWLLMTYLYEGKARLAIQMIIRAENFLKDLTGSRMPPRPQSVKNLEKMAP